MPVSVAGMSVYRTCASELKTIATAARKWIVDGVDVVVAGGVESISLVQTPNRRVDEDPQLLDMVPDIYMPMLQTAEIVAQRYGISRERQDAYALRSQQRTAKAQEAGAFAARSEEHTSELKSLMRTSYAVSCLKKKK